MDTCRSPGRSSTRRVADLMGQRVHDDLATLDFSIRTADFRFQLRLHATSSYRFGVFTDVFLNVPSQERAPQRRLPP